MAMIRLVVDERAVSPVFSMHDSESTLRPVEFPGIPGHRIDGR